MATIRDAAAFVAARVVQVNSPKGKGPRFTPEKRPKTAADRLELEHDLDVVADIVAAATPWAEPPRRRTDDGPTRNGHRRAGISESW